MGKHRNCSFWARLDHYPPILIRILARTPDGSPMATEEIAQSSGLSSFYVESIANQTDWSMVPIGHARAYLNACKIDLDNPKQMKVQEVYLQGKIREGQRQPPSFRYLKKSQKWEAYYRPMMMRYLESLKKKVSPPTSM